MIEQESDAIDRESLTMKPTKNEIKLRIGKLFRGPMLLLSLRLLIPTNSSNGIIRLQKICRKDTKKSNLRSILLDMHQTNQIKMPSFFKSTKITKILNAEIIEF